MIPTSTRPCACSARTAWCGKSGSETLKRSYRKQYPDLNPDFIFAFPAYNVRSTEINAVLGRSQLKRLDQNNERRRRQPPPVPGPPRRRKYRTDFEVEGSCNYAFTLILSSPTRRFRDRLEHCLREAKVEFRRGTSGGGNQLRQPYVRKLLGDRAFERLPGSGPRALLRLLYRQLSGAGAEQNSGLVRHAQPARVKPQRPAHEPTA